MGPVAARADAGGVAEGRERFGAHSLALGVKVDVHADGTEVEVLDERVARRVEDGVEVPFVDHVARAVDFDDEVAHALHDLAVGTMVAVLGGAKEDVAVGHFP